MTPAESQYFALMRAALWEQPVELEVKPDWKGIMRIAKHHATQVLVSSVASCLEGEQAPDEALLQEMKVSMRNNLINQLELKQILTKAVLALRKEGIEPVLLKGFGLARLYPNPNLRQFGDIDIFVGLDDFHKACGVLRSLPGGYNWGEEVDAGRHYNIEFGRHPMEVHRVSVDVSDPREREIYAAIEREGLLEQPQHIDLDGFDLVVPSKDFMVFFTFLHAWHHFLTSGVGWRQVSDVAMSLHAYCGQLDLDKLQQWLDSMHLMEPWQAFGWLMVENLGLPEEEMPFYNSSSRSTAQKLYIRIMAEGNFRRRSRFKQRTPHTRLAKKAHSFIGVFVDFFQLASIFPLQSRIEMRTKLKQAFSKNFQKK